MACPPPPSKKKKFSDAGAAARGCGSNSNASFKVCAIVENRARETCIATIDTAHSSVLQVSCVQDSQSYAKTLAALSMTEVDEILLHDGARGRVLSLKIVGAFHGETSRSRVLFVSRQYFDQDKGAELLKRLASGSVDAEMVSKYTALAASYCLLRYIENNTGHAFANGSLRIRTDQGGDSVMSVDRSTAKELELIADARSGGQKKSLFGVINHTRTAVGARLLRSTILRPCTDVATIEDRLDLVTFFLTSEGVFTNTLNVLGDFMDLDRMLSDLVTVPKQVTPVTAGRGIATLICLRHTLRLMGPLADALEEGVQESGASGEQKTGDAQTGDPKNPSPEGPREVKGGSPLLLAMLDIFRDPVLQKLLEKLDSILTEGTTYLRNSAAMRHQECFAVRPDVDGMLDVSRKTFLQSMDDIFQTADTMSEECDYQVKVTFSASRGYHLVIPAGVETLPTGLVQAVQNVKTITCTTEEVASLSERAREAVRSALLITHGIVQNLAEDIRVEGLDSLFAVAESVALLDMIFGFADLVTLSPLNFCRPKLTTEGPMIIRGGRHPIVGAVQECKFVPNDTYLSPFMNFRVVTGPNNSGKSTYLKQAGLIVLMAQMGSFVPADVAVIPVRDRLLSRIGTGDDMENNVSTFLMEMREVSQALERVTSRSLVLIDELGRGTSNQEGLAIAWAVAEKLLSSCAYTLFVTHYTQIPGLADLYPNVKNIHLETAVMTSSAGKTTGLRYLHKAQEGRCNPGDAYGIRTAEMCGLPWEIVEDARALRAQVIANAKAKSIQGSTGALSQGEYDAHELLRTLAMLKGSTMDDSTLREFLHVLSLDYKASKTERITATLSAVTRSVGATAASKTTTEPDAALGYEKDGVGLAQEGGPHSPAAAPTYSGEMLDATGATERGLPSPPTQDLSTSTISAAAQTTGCIDAVDGRATVRDRNVGSGSGDGGECVGAATISSTELDMSPANTRTDEFSGNFGSIAEAGTAIGKVSISGGGW